MSSAFDRPGEASDAPDEAGAASTKPTSRSDTWLNLDNESDEKLLSFLGLDRDDSAEADTASESGTWPALREKVPAAEDQAEAADDVGEVGKPDDSLRRQQALGKEVAAGIEKEIDRKIDKTIDDLNPRFDPGKSAYRENCTGVVQAYELQRRDIDVQPGPLEKHLQKDEGGPGGRSVSTIEQAWGRAFTPGTQQDIEAAFSEPGARGIVLIKWHPAFGVGRHVFNVENVGGNVRFVDGQPKPAVDDASYYFGMGMQTKYLRLDDLPTPPPQATKPYLEP